MAETYWGMVKRFNTYDFDSYIRWFESSYPSFLEKGKTHYTRAKTITTLFKNITSQSFFILSQALRKAIQICQEVCSLFQYRQLAWVQILEFQSKHFLDFCTQYLRCKADLRLTLLNMFDEVAYRKLLVLKRKAFYGINRKTVQLVID